METVSVSVNREFDEKTEYVRPPFQFGCLKGVIDIDDDFTDVLEDFKEII